MKNVQDIVSKFKRGIQNGQKSYVDGVNAVREAPGEAAAKAADKYAEGVRRAAEDGTYAAGCRAVPLAAWQERTSRVGGKRYAESAADAESGFAKYMEWAAPQIASIQASVKAMPNNTEADADARMLENVKRMRQLKYTRRR